MYLGGMITCPLSSAWLKSEKERKKQYFDMHVVVIIRATRLGDYNYTGTTLHCSGSPFFCTHTNTLFPSI